MENHNHEHEHCNSCSHDNKHNGHDDHHDHHCEHNHDDHHCEHKHEHKHEHHCTRCEHHHDHHDHHGHDHHGHHHHHSGSKKGAIIRIIIGAFLLGAAFAVDKLFNLPMWALLLIYLVPYIEVGFGVLKETVENVSHGEIFDENFLMTIATVAALLVGFLPSGKAQFEEAVFVMLFYKIGEFIEMSVEDNSRRSIDELMKIRPDKADVLRDGNVISVDAQTVAVGETIVVKTGEIIPIDGVVIEGRSSLDTKAITGESRPQTVREGNAVMSGCVNNTGVLYIKTVREFGESSASKILELVENANEKKSKSEKFITKFAAVYTPIVVLIALVIAFVPPFFTGDYIGSLSDWLLRAATMLIVSCPCALIVSVPLAYFGGIGGAAKQGILIKGAEYMETLSKLKTVVFDKTGTLTKGVFEVTAIHPEKCDENTLLHLAAHVERFSTHPIASSLRQAFGDEKDGCDITDVTELSGHGVSANVNGKTVCVGNEKYMASLGVKIKDCDRCKHNGTTVHVSIDGEYAGHIVISDKIKKDAAETVTSMRMNGIKTVMLTGDSESVGKAVAEELDLDDYHAGLLPDEKEQILEKMIRKNKGKVAFVGDGINDAPSLAVADVGIAMGSAGSGAAIEAADVVLMDDKPSKVLIAIRSAKKTVKIARQNTFFAIFVKVAVLVLASFGIAPMALAVFADVGVTLIAVLNSIRTVKV